MNEININRFDVLLTYVHSHENGVYTLYDINNNYIEAFYETDYESDNGLDEDDNRYEEYQCIAFRRLSDGVMFEVNYHNIPIKALCDGETVYS